MTGRWRKSKFSAYNGSCVEVDDSVPGPVAVRDSKAGPHGAVLTFDRADWAQFLRTLKAGGSAGQAGGA